MCFWLFLDDFWRKEGFGRERVAERADESERLLRLP